MLVGAGLFAVLAGLWAMQFYESDKVIWALAAAVTLFGVGSLGAGVLQRAGLS